MRKLYNEYYFIPKNGKISDKVFVIRIAVSFCIIVACLISMSFTAYAYFTANIAISGNTVKASTFQLEMSGLGEVDTLRYQAGGTPITLPKADTDQTVSLTVVSGKTGYCLIKSSGLEKPYLLQFSEENKDGSITYTADADTEITLEVGWGTYAKTDQVTEVTNAPIVFSASSVEAPTDPNGESQA